MPASVSRVNAQEFETMQLAKPDHHDADASSTILLNTSRCPRCPTRLL